VLISCTPQEYNPSASPRFVFQQISKFAACLTIQIGKARIFHPPSAAHPRVDSSTDQGGGKRRDGKINRLGFVI
jgi:hypothetical protein